MGTYQVALRRYDRSPVVLSNAPFFDDDTPMPTRFWLCDPRLVRDISQIESDGGVKRAEAEISSDQLSATHELAAAERNALIGSDHRGPRPHGGVGGTRRGIKCLHSHFANYLAGAPDAVGEWVQRELVSRNTPYDACQPGISSR